ncbi:hypothetical protein KSZ_51280 [Dictyobacter formicarum]|uniref:Uncharacterized protein n=1 Tax=Dictyobacter formicarum TaxID=2778368 RepID=A0ABQ3VLN1_9CHLR|nr:hypothetical protein [Dictyobacter formicarum]GHO87122.1 hypothetical protein KSZ_51280 [Dictyobacter formicarum]
MITEAGNDPQVVRLVYIAAFAPDKGESVSTLLKEAQPGTPASSILPPQDGYLYQDKSTRSDQHTIGRTPLTPLQNHKE